MATMDMGVSIPDKVASTRVEAATRGAAASKVVDLFKVVAFKAGALLLLADGRTWGTSVEAMAMVRLVVASNLMM
jgi:hypothetical protein